MRRPNVCFQGQCAIDPRALSMIRMPGLPSVPSAAYSTQTHTHAHTRSRAQVVLPTTTRALRMCLVSPSSFMNINLKRLVSSVSGPGPGAEEVTPGH